jgi:hypothetical protein
MTTRKIIKLPDHLVSYKTSCPPSGTVRVPNKAWTYVCVLSDETFLRLWFKCKTIEQFTESYAHNHEDSYKPSIVSCKTRAKNIGYRLAIELPFLGTERKDALRSEKDRLRHLVEDLSSGRCWGDYEELDLGIIPPVIQ